MNGFTIGLLFFAAFSASSVLAESELLRTRQLFNGNATDFLKVWSQSPAEVVPLSDGEIARATTALLPYLRSWTDNPAAPHSFQISLQRLLHNFPDGYAAQVVGVKASSGSKILFNVFCYPAGSVVPEGYRMVLDGGECAWQVEFNLATQSFSRLELNGEA